MSSRSNEPASSEPRASRRQFIKAASAAGVVAAVGPAIHAADKTDKKLPILGSGDHTYEVHHNWGQLPDHITWGDTHGVCVDQEGQIYVKHLSGASEPMDAIVVFDPQGRFVRSFGKEYHGGGHGIDVRRDGGEQFLYLSDIKNRQVVKTTLKGEQVWKLDYPQEPDVYKSENQYRPTNVAFAPDGGFYIGDGYGSHYIHQYDKDARWVRTWGGAGTEPGKMRTPHGLWLDDRPGRKPSLAVCDRANARLQYFDLEGNHLSFVEGMSFPADIDIQGEVMLVPDLQARVTLLDKENKVIDHLGYDAAWTENVMKNGLRGKADQWEAGRFVHPHDACFDKDGNIFVVEWVPIGRVSWLKRVS
jgi:hypothetical protein